MTDKPHPCITVEDPSPKSVENHFHNNLHWVSPENVLSYPSWSCVDGREDEKILGTPGGFSGEMILGLCAQYKNSDDIQQEQIESLLTEAAKKGIMLYYHTDEKSFKVLSQKVGAIFLNSDLNQDEKRKEIAKEFIDPNHVGCGHIKYILTDAASAEEKEEAKIAQKYIAAFCNVYLNYVMSPKSAAQHNIKFYSPLDFDILPGEHNEKGLLKIQTKVDEEGGESAPKKVGGWAVSPWPTNTKQILSAKGPHDNVTSYFVYHPEATSYYRYQIASIINPKDADGLYKKMNVKFTKYWLPRTLKHLMTGKCTFKAVIPRE